VRIALAGKSVAGDGERMHGTTKTFGILTYNALREFQKKAGIVPASGYFGPKTRAYVNAAEKYYFQIPPVSSSVLKCDSTGAQPIKSGDCWRCG
jgi:peptidoglycan hydrolase-like protein with peptidoglycan-binding domain